MAVTGVLIVIVIASDAAAQGPAPSGSGVFHINVIVVPASPAAGVYIAVAVFLSGLNVPLPPVQLPPVDAVATIQLLLLN